MFKFRKFWSSLSQKTSRERRNPSTTWRSQHNSMKQNHIKMLNTFQLHLYAKFQILGNLLAAFQNKMADIFHCPSITHKDDHFAKKPQKKPNTLKINCIFFKDWSTRTKVIVQKSLLLLTTPPSNNMQHFCCHIKIIKCMYMWIKCLSI